MAPRSSLGGAQRTQCLLPGERSTTGGASCGSSIACPNSTNDPLYDKDIGFYLFALPAYVVIENSMLLTLLLSGLTPGAISGSTATSSTTPERQSMSPTAMAHGSVIFGFLLGS